MPRRERRRKLRRSASRPAASRSASSPRRSTTWSPSRSSTAAVTTRSRAAPVASQARRGSYGSRTTRSRAAPTTPVTSRWGDEAAAAAGAIRPPHCSESAIVQPATNAREDRWRYEDGSRRATSSPATRSDALVGRGGMGEVYRALDLRLERPVALKLLSERLSDDEAFRDRMLRESRLAASLDHPNVVPIYEAGEADGRLFIAMRYVDGTDLKALLARRARSPRSGPSRSPRRSRTRSTRRTRRGSSTAT